jgi:hypothetical protein
MVGSDPHALEQFIKYELAHQKSATASNKP